MLVHAAAPLREHAPWLRDALDALAAKVSAGTRTAETALHILLDPAHALDHASAHILLTASGYPDPAFQRHLDAATDPRHGPAVASERLPHHELEHQWFGRLLGRPTPRTSKRPCSPRAPWAAHSTRWARPGWTSTPSPTA